MKFIRAVVAHSIGLLKWVLGLSLLIGAAMLLTRLYAPSEWRCLLVTGDFISTFGEPSGEWVQDEDGTIYPLQRVEQCVEMTE